MPSAFVVQQRDHVSDGLAEPLLAPARLRSRSQLRWDYTGTYSIAPVSPSRIMSYGNQ